jgi:hypothetical protein
MREDLNKQLCERQRTRSYKDYGEYRHDKHFKEHYDLDFDDEPFGGVGSHGREGMKHRYGWDQKSFNENLKPLYGFIRKSLGKKWDKVYSEICSVFDKRSVINQHILIHLFQYVETNNIRVGTDGKLYHEIVSSWRSENRLRPLKDSYIEYYVDPRDGILKYNHSHKTRRQVARQQQAERAKEEAKVKKVVDKFTELHKLKDVWFEVKFIEREPRVYTGFETVSYARRPIFRTYREYDYKYDVLKDRSVTDARVAVSKRQLSKKEIKRHGLA